MNSETRFFSHKGRADEHTLPNSLEALLSNYQGAMECDLVLLDDGTIGILHPRDFGTSVDEVEHLDLPRLEQMKIPSTDPKRPGRAVPLLEELAGLGSDTDTRLMMELKASTKERAMILAEKAIQALKKIQDEDGFRLNPEFINSRLVFQSTSVAVLEQVNATAKAAGFTVTTNFALPTNEGWAAKTPVFDIEDMAQMDSSLTWAQKGLTLATQHGMTEIEFDQQLVTPELVAEAHDAGVHVGVSLCPDAARRAALEAMGVDYILFEA